MEKLNLKRTWWIDPWLIVVLACFSLFAWASWGKLAHPMFEPGPETEIVARLLEGEVLYRDLQSYYTPLAYYANALALLIFGHHLEVFYAVGLVLALTIVLLAYRLMKLLTNAQWAALCCIYLVVYCAFKPGGLFNLAVPYSYGAVYATALCLCALTALDCYGRAGRLRWLSMAAIATGCAGLAKQEFGVAALAAVLVGANLFPANSFKVRVGRSCLVILAAAMTAIVPLAVLAQQASWEQISNSVIPIAKSQMLIEAGILFWSPAQTLIWWRGNFRDFIKNLVIIGICVVTASKIATYLTKYRFRKNNRNVEDLTKFAIGIVGAALSLFGLQTMQWVTPHPLGNLIWLLPVSIAWFASGWRSLIQHRHGLLLWALLTFAIVLNARFWFNLDFYGIYAVTAILLLFTILKSWNSWIKFPIWNFVLVCLLVGGIGNLVQFSQYRYPICSTYGCLYTNEPALALTYDRTIDYINKSGAKSVLTIPAGAILNFLTATHSPSQETFFLPGILPDAAAERNFIDQMQKKPPDLIIYVDLIWSWHKKGYQTYSQFNPLVANWITQQHQLVYTSPKLVYGLFDKADKEWTLKIYKRSI